MGKIRSTLLKSESLTDVILLFGLYTSSFILIYTLRREVRGGIGLFPAFIIKILSVDVGEHKLTSDYPPKRVMIWDPQSKDKLSIHESCYIHRTGKQCIHKTCSWNKQLSIPASVLSWMDTLQGGEAHSLSVTIQSLATLLKGEGQGPLGDGWFREFLGLPL